MIRSEASRSVRLQSCSHPLIQLYAVLALLFAAASVFQTSAASCQTAPTGIIGWWAGDGNANDIAGTYNGTLVGGATATAAGQVGQAFTFDGTNGYVQIPDNAALKPANLTIEAWVRFSGLDSAGNAGAGQQYIVFKQNTRSGFFEGYALTKTRVSGSDRFDFQVSSSAGAAAEVTSTTAITVGTWYHVAAVRGPSTIQLYVNGALQASAAVSFAQDYGTQPLFLGTSGQSYWDRKFKGTLDEVSLYNRALTSNEVAATYVAGAAGKCKTTGGITIGTQPQSQTVAVGANVNFTVAASGPPTLGYQWQYNGAFIPGQTGTSLALSNVQLGDAGNYTAVVSNSTASVTSSVAVLTVMNPPQITSDPQSSTNAAGTSVGFTSTASGSAPLGYQWRLNGTALSNGGRISGATSTAVSITGLTLADSGNYTLIASNAVGQATSAVATLTVLVGPSVTVSPAGQSVLAGANVGFTANASGTAPLSYLWTFNGGPLSDGGQVSGASSSALSLNNVQSGNQGNYQVIVGNSVGSVTSSVATLTVNQPGSCSPPPSGILGWWPADGDATTLVGTNNGLLVGGASATAAGEVGQTFTFDGTNAYVQIPDSTAFRPTNLTVEAWVRFSGLDSAGNAQAGQQYIIFRQNTRNSFFEGFALTKTRVSGADYFTFQVSSSAGATVAVNSTTAISAGVWYHVAGVRGPSTLQIYVNGQLQNQASVTFAQDYGSNPLFLGTSGYASWDRKFKGNLDEVTFYKRDLNASEINAIYTAGNGGKCKVSSGLAINSQPQSQSVIVNSNALFTVGVTGVAPFSYQWYFGSTPLSNGGSIGGATSSALSITGVQPGDQGNYSVVVTNSTGSVTSSVAVLTVTPAPVAPNITVDPVSQTVKAGTNVTFTVTATGTAPLSYRWWKNTSALSNGGNVSGATSSALALSSVTAADAANYFAVVTNAAGGATSQVASLTVNIPPSITTPPTGVNGTAGGSASFTAAATGTAPLGYQWYFNGNPLANGGQFSGVTTTNLTITGLTTGNGGNYSVTVSNLAGTASASAVLAFPGGCIAPPSGLVGWWPGEGNANDIIGGNNGTLQGGAIATTPGYVGNNAFLFNGTSSYVSIPDSPVFHPAQLTVECWVRFDAYQTPGTSLYPYQQYCVFKQTSQTYEFEGFALTKDNDPQGNVILWEVASASHVLVRIDSVNTVVTGTWYHLAGVRGPDYVKLYLNGHLEAQASVNFPQDYGTLPLYFGTSGQSYYDRKLQGALDEVSLYNRPLTDAEVLAIYQAGRGGKCRPVAPGAVQSPAAVVESLSILPPFMKNGNLNFTVVGPSGRGCTVEASTDMNTWTETSTMTLTDGAAAFAQPISGDFKFYRAKLVPQQ